MLIKISKEKDCCALSTWIGPCLNHFLWSATSTLSGNEMLIWAKFKSFLYHVVNKRKHLPDVIFNKCAHGDNIEEQMCLEEGLSSPLSCTIFRSFVHDNLIKCFFHQN